MKRIWLGVFGLFALLAASGLSLSTGGGAALGASNGTTYRVEIENLTTGRPGWHSACGHVDRFSSLRSPELKNAAKTRPRAQTAPFPQACQV